MPIILKTNTGNSIDKEDRAIRAVVRNKDEFGIPEIHLELQNSTSIVFSKDEIRFIISELINLSFLRI